MVSTRKGAALPCATAAIPPNTDALCVAALLQVSTEINRRDGNSEGELQQALEHADELKAALAGARVLTATPFITLLVLLVLLLLVLVLLVLVLVLLVLLVLVLLLLLLLLVLVFLLVLVLLLLRRSCGALFAPRASCGLRAARPGREDRRTAASTTSYYPFLSQ